MRRNIEAERVRKGLSKEALAKELGISLKTYYNWVSKEMDMPSSVLIKMSKMFGVEIGYLLDGATGVPTKRIDSHPKYSPNKKCLPYLKLK